MCSGRKGHGQCVPGPFLHCLFHGVVHAVSVFVVRCLVCADRAAITPFIFLQCVIPVLLPQSPVFPTSTCVLFECARVSDHRQYYSSFKTGNMDQALSIWFLLLWLGGDSCNLVGSTLADQLPLQVGAALVYKYNRRSGNGLTMSLLIRFCFTVDTISTSFMDIFFSPPRIDLHGHLLRYG